MSDTLIGVVIGGLIASISPIATLVTGHLKWKKETKINHLRTEREKLELLFDKNLKIFGECANTNTYPSDMTTDILILMPKDVSSAFLKFMRDKDKTEEKGKSAYFDLAFLMKAELLKIDKEIQSIIS